MKKKLIEYSEETEQNLKQKALNDKMSLTKFITKTLKEKAEEK